MIVVVTRIGEVHEGERLVAIVDRGDHAGLVAGAEGDLFPQPRLVRDAFADDAQQLAVAQVDMQRGPAAEPKIGPLLADVTDRTIVARVGGLLFVGVEIGAAALGELPRWEFQFRAQQVWLSPELRALLGPGFATPGISMRPAIRLTTADSRRSSAGCGFTHIPDPVRSPAKSMKRRSPASSPAAKQRSW